MFNIFQKKRKEPLKLPFKTDIHCHLVPGVDDGSPDAATSAELIERMQRWGIERIIASPHVTQYTFENTPDILDPALEELQEELRRRGNAIVMERSAEYRIDEFFLKQMEAKALTPYPNSYLLIENSFMQEPWNLDQLIFDLQVRGFRPVLAHPERYTYYYGKPSRYKELHDAGLMFQINLLSLAGNYGKAEKKMAEKLLEDGMVDFIGTDLHNSRHAAVIDEYLMSKDAEKHFAMLESVIQNDKAFI
ncbi:MAG: hypothetical protein K1V78_01430 [Muribaculaceae bacterium]|jgi:tyrosine-protein phosphatase YwqE